MSLLLDLIYLLALLLASPWIVFRLSRERGWRPVPQRFGFGIGPPLTSSIWLHGSSVGEISLLKPLIGALEEHFPGVPLVVTSYTMTGFAAARRAYPGLRVLPFPVDFSFVIEHFMRRLRPALIVIVESDFWPNHLRCALRHHVPLAVVNGKLSEKSLRMHSRIRLIPRLLRHADVLAVQTEEHGDRFVRLGVPRRSIHVTGNMKYDLAHSNPNAEERAETRARLGFADEDVVVIGGSLHPGEDAALLESFDAVRRAQPRAALLIVPRYPAQAAAVASRAVAAGFSTVLKTSVDSGEASPPGPSGVLVADTLGELGSLYTAADIAFVGGSLYYRGANKGGHNLMEPAILGIPVLFGPYNFSFKETVADLLAADAGVLVHDAAELTTALEKLVGNAVERGEIGRRARNVILQGQGATARNLDLLSALLGDGSQLQGPPVASTMPPAVSDSGSS